nr:endospore germination permease [Aneurinibacillus sp. XH2]
MSDKYTVRQFAIMVALFSIGTAILIVPSSMAELARQDAWIAAVIGTGLGLCLSWLYTVVGKRNQGLTLMEMNDKAFGSLAGKIISLTFVFFTFVTSAEQVYFMGQFITIQILPGTPMWAVNITCIMLVLYSVRLGLVTIARSADILFLFVVFLFFILLVALSPQIDINHLGPVMAEGPKPIIKASVFYMSIFSLTPVVFLMFYPSGVNKPDKANRAFVIGAAIGGAVLILMIFLAIAVLGAQMTEMQVYPSYSLAKMINVGDFFQRVEVIVATLWFVTIYYKMTILFYVSATGLTHIFKLKDYRPLTLPLGMILAILSLIVHPDYAHNDYYNKQIWLPYGGTYGIILPLVLLAVTSFRRNAKNKG